MQRRNLVISIVVILLLIIFFVLFVNSGVDYSTFNQAKETGKKVQVIGKVVNTFDKKYENGQLEFLMVDDSNTVVKVKYRGAVPQSFDIADKIVVKGVMRKDYFESNEILTKCPSKYENK